MVTEYGQPAALHTAPHLRSMARVTYSTVMPQRALPVTETGPIVTPSPYPPHRRPCPPSLYTITPDHIPRANAHQLPLLHSLSFLRLAPRHPTSTPLSPAHLPPQPQIPVTFNWYTSFTAAARIRLDALTARELAVLLWALARMDTRGTDTRVAGGGAGTPLDRPFLDAWFRCAAKRMGGATPASLVLALQALAALRVN